MVRSTNTLPTKTIKKPQATSFSQRKQPIVKLICWLIAILLGAVQAWANRFTVFSEDSISYIDVADAYLRGDWQAAINGNWSPLYSWILGLFFFIFKPSSYWEFPTVKLANFLIYLFSLACFEFLLSTVISGYKAKSLSKSSQETFLIPEWVWLIWGYTLFIWSSLRWIGVECDTPDMFTAGVVYLAAAIVLRIHTKSSSWRNFVILGVVLGIGYLSKSVMFPLAFVFLTIALFSVGKMRQAIPKTLVALLIFALITTPFISAISLQKGRLTIGEAGKLSYAWYISPKAKDHYWRGDPPNSGIPKNPPRKIFNNPSVYEFDNHLNVTYPIWYDPSYWNDGLQPKFDILKQIKVVFSNLKHYYNLFLAVLVFGYLILACIGGSISRSRKDLVANWRLFTPAIAGLMIYMVVTDLPHLKPLDTRYLAPFIVLLFTATLSSIHLPNSQEVKRLLIGMTLGIFIVFGGKFSNQLLEDFNHVLHQPQHIYWEIAEGLKDLGIQPGDKVAHLGYKKYYWARLAKVEIVAEIPKAEYFWQQDEATRDRIFQALQKTGAKAVILKKGTKPPNSESVTNWQELKKTQTFAYLLPNQ
ncbi:glycosyltransferase family 39 protein [Floridanema evergladense]|uniref:Glycosyltransferase family 39 protein n=1 Tax=Floridaenema evergladense BLCC-F167 TaxID=3153639 RepID=A0ABV4WG01_9CYAN